MTKVSGIYGILPADLQMADLLAKAEAALKGGVRTLQFRDKKQGYKRAIKRARALRDLTRDYQALLIVNDSVKLAVDSEADGVHLGRDDAPNLIQLRSEVGDDLIVGITCRADAAFAKTVLKEGANYVSFGAVWTTMTKPEVPELGLARLAKACQMFPDADVCAIGGITAGNVVQVKAAGADCAAVVSGLFAADDIEARAQLLTALWSRA
ncbi:thiamine-phosphate diphosphorylase [Mariprofundus ferrinatatus]|uniref:Thiamine-phosphate synthase n=1 Tax=Mariprofundus ferrinatatus TaxID=1921087 RepID=A0A2K8L4K5_9PROT|nr:thiamine phosphate synthase [Mariprofundus ferrinatatus]ATX82260.1 thiamine-phosphate diphosphorylase [Mariprofundus ferrinatatus]